MKRLFFMLLLFGQLYIASYACQRPFYSVNLMWVNKSLNCDQKFIHPLNDEQEMRKYFLDRIFAWARIGSRDSVVQVWYDSALVPSQAIANTKALIEKQRQVEDMTPILLKDVRSLKKVIANNEVFSNLFPVFFRVDLLRVIAAVQAVSTDETQYFVYADLDMNPLTKDQLFDIETMLNLKQFGTVMPRGTAQIGYENGFFILGQDNAHLLEAMSLVVVDLNIKRARRLLDRIEQYEQQHGQFNHLNFDANNESEAAETDSEASEIRFSIEDLREVVFESYVEMFNYFFHLECLGAMTGGDNIYKDEEIRNLQPFCLDYKIRLHNVRNKYFFTPINKPFCTVPTKAVPLPESCQHKKGYDHVYFSRIHDNGSYSSSWYKNPFIYRILSLKETCSLNAKELIKQLVKWAQEHQQIDLQPIEASSNERDLVGEKTTEYKKTMESLAHFAEKNKYNLPLQTDFGKCIAIASVLANLQKFDENSNEIEPLSCFVGNMLTTLKYPFHQELCFYAISSIPVIKNQKAFEELQKIYHHAELIIPRLIHNYEDTIATLVKTIESIVSQPEPNYCAAMALANKLETYIASFEVLQQSSAKILNRRMPELNIQKADKAPRQLIMDRNDFENQQGLTNNTSSYFVIDDSQHRNSVACGIGNICGIQ